MKYFLLFVFPSAYPRRSKGGYTAKIPFSNIQERPDKLKIADNLVICTKIVSLTLKQALLLSIFLLSCLSATAQKRLYLVTSPESKQVLSQFHYKNQVPDSLSAARSLEALLHSLHSEGYLTACVQNMHVAGDSIRATLETGKRFRWATLREGNIDRALLSRLGYNQRFFTRKPFRYHEVSKLMEKIIVYSENNGYPFAAVKLDSIQIAGDSISAAFQYSKGPLIAFDSVRIHGDTHTKAGFLGNYLRIKHGTVYDERKVKNAEARLRRLPYLSVAAPAYVSFQNQQGTLHLELENKKANQLHGVIGLLPNEAEGKGVLLTGEFDLLLHNLFGSGKKVAFRWQRIRELSQLLDAEYYHPNLLGSPLNAGVSFHLRKEDTTYINRTFEVRFSYLLGSYSSLEVYGNFKTSRLIGASGRGEAAVPADLAGFHYNAYGLRYSWEDLDDYLMPRRGMTFYAGGGIGAKDIIDPGSGQGKDSLPQNNVQYSFEAELTRYFRIGKRITVKGQAGGRLMVSDRLFLNDLYRPGGLNSLRGFAESSFMASAYGLFTLEPRIYLDSESFLFLFADQAYVQYDLDNRKFEDYPTGIGAGVSFTTKAGVFNFAYALGRTRQQPFDINLSKIHFGYVTRF